MFRTVSRSIALLAATGMTAAVVSVGFVVSEGVGPQDSFIKAVPSEASVVQPSLSIEDGSDPSIQLVVYPKKGGKNKKLNPHRAKCRCI